MSTTRKLTLTFILFAVALTSAVCGGCGGSDHPDLGQVQGTVTMDEEPLADATVTFVPEEGRPSSGITNSNGEYELTYVRDTKGAVLGHHKVRILAVEEDASAEDTEFPEDTASQAKESIPAKYNTQTTLTADVEKGKNTFDFDLKSQ
jgi:hypothetical protein